MNNLKLATTKRANEIKTLMHNAGFPFNVRPSKGSLSRCYLVYGKGEIMSDEFIDFLNINNFKSAFGEPIKRIHFNGGLSIYITEEE